MIRETWEIETIRAIAADIGPDAAAEVADEAPGDLWDSLWEDRVEPSAAALLIIGHAADVERGLLAVDDDAPADFWAADDDEPLPW